MIKIKPFKAVFYNPEKRKDLSRLVCPPYDIISPRQQDYYHNLNPYNFIHILLGKDAPGENKYIRSRVIFKKWLAEKILVQDNQPAIYFYSQQYNIRGETKTRLGFIGLLKLGDSDAAVFGHEHTRRQAKEDRLKIIRSVKANLSPIFIVSRDNKRIIQRVYERYVKNTPVFMEAVDNEKTVHKIWRIDSCSVINIIETGMLKEDAFIADGHHRYEVSCAWRDEMKEKLGDKIPADSTFDYTLAYFTNSDRRSLSILPIHRLLSLDRELDFGEFILKLKVYFDVEEFKDKDRFFFLMAKAGVAEHLLGLYKDKRFWLLRLKNIKILNKLMADKPDAYRRLDVSILNHIVFKEVLGYDSVDKNSLVYSPDAQELIALADTQPEALVFFLNPVKLEQIIAVALKGDKMPAKSTYFYPKVLSGLVVNRHQEF